MEPRLAGSVLLVSTVLIFGGHQAPVVSAAPGQGFIPGIPTVVKTPVALVKAIAIPGAPLASTDVLWVDEASKRMFFADRSDFGFDLIDRENDSFACRRQGLIRTVLEHRVPPHGELV